MKKKEGGEGVLEEVDFFLVFGFLSLEKKGTKKARIKRPVALSFFSTSKGTHVRGSEGKKRKERVKVRESEGSMKVQWWVVLKFKS